MISNNKISAVEYDTYESLSEFASGFNLDKFAKEIINILEDESEWYEQFKGINDLRRIQKFYTLKFHYLFRETYPFILRLSASIRSNLSKLALILIKEFFKFQKFNLQEISMLKKTISSVLIQSAVMKAFIKEEALAGLEEIASNDSFCNLHIVSILIEEMTNKNLQIAENAYATSEKILKNMTFEDFTSHDSNLPNVLIQIVNLYYLKKDHYSKKALRTYEQILIKLGKEGLNYYLNNGNAKSYKNVLDEMEKIILSKSKSRAQTGSIKEVIKSKRFNNDNF
jgi:hypothetical protein